MRMMEGSILIHLVWLLAAMTLLLLAVLYLHVNKARISRSAFPAAALFLLGALAMQFMTEAIIGLDAEKLFLQARDILGVLFLVTIGIFTMQCLKSRGDKIQAGSFHKFADLLAKVEDTVLIFDADGHVVRVQDKNKQIGLLPESIQHIDQLKPTFSDDAPSRDMSRQFVLPTPSGHVFQVSLSPISNEKGQGIGHTAVLSDITRQRQLLASLEESNNRLRESNQRLLREVGLAEQLQHEKQRLVLITEIQSELVTRIDRAILTIEQMEKSASDGDFPEKNEILSLSDELDAVYGRVREVVRSISPRRGEPVHD